MNCAGDEGGSASVEEEGVLIMSCNSLFTMAIVRGREDPLATYLSTDLSVRKAMSSRGLLVARTTALMPSFGSL